MQHGLWRHPNGVWYVRWRERGGTRRVSTGCRDRDAAKAWAARFAARLDREPPQQLTIAAIVDGYLADRRPQVASPQTLAAVCARIRAHFGALTPADFAQAAVRRYALARGAGAGTVIRELGALRAALNWAGREGWIAPGAVPRFTMPVAQPKGRERWLSRDEAARLIAACAAPHVRLFTVIALTTGARRQAIETLRWSQVDLARRVINFGEDVGNKRKAVAKINDSLVGALTEAHELATCAWVIEYAGDRAGSVKKAFARAARRAGLQGVTPHTLRHTAATWMMEAGVPIREAARQLGMSEKMVETRYGHHSPDYLERAAGALELGQAANERSA